MVQSGAAIEGTPGKWRHRVPDGTRVYAVGDIHGRTDLLQQLHELILADAATGEAARRVVVYLGDYVDRGWDSRGVIDMLLEHPLDGLERVHLRGNHDAWLLDFILGTGSGMGWLLNGGDATLASYGVMLPDMAAREDDLEEARDELGDALPREHLDFLRRLSFIHVEGDYLFVHAGIRPGVPLEEQDPYDLMWIRDEFLSSDVDHGKVVVHGHTPTHQVQLRPNRIGIDTGAFATNRLTCLVLERDERRFLQT